ncbi:hypothetical protein D3C80_1555860 [compost metagenome]
MHHRERGFEAVRQIGQRGAIFIVAIALAFEQSIEVSYQTSQFAGGFWIEFFSIVFFKFAHLFGQRFYRPQAPPGRDPQQRDHQQQVCGQHIHEPAPDHIGAF